MKRSLLFVLILMLLLPSAFAQEAQQLSPALHSLWEGDQVIPGSMRTGHAGYWETPMDITNEEAVWAMLTAPITVVKGHQKKQTYLLAEPRDDAQPVADITFDSQGLHILETLDNGWTKVEAYSSSFFDSKLKRWNELVSGYIRTDKLETRQPKTKFGLVVDKLTQRLYIFEDGKLLDVLRASTGLPNDRQPYNETRSGEFLLVSRVGDFRSDNMIAGMGIRFNSGDILHEVPHLIRNGEKSFGIHEEQLGQRASHGCIRIQRKRSDQGISMAWLWKNITNKQLDTKLVIWEDVMGRQIAYPAADTLVYHVPAHKGWYHEAETCYNVRSVNEPMQAIPYSDLDTDAFRKYKPCTFCVPPLRRGDIEEINRAHQLQP